MSPPRTLVVHSADDANRTLSYQLGWPEALERDLTLGAETVNLSVRGAAAGLTARSLLGRRRFDAVLLLHSVFSNVRNLSGHAFEAIRRLDAPKVYFIGNEYKLMPEKMAFAEELGVNLLVTQIASPEVAGLYRARLGCEVEYISNTGIDPEVFAARTPWHDRPIEIGYRGFDAPLYLGHIDRRRLPEAFLNAQERLALRLDISLDAEARFDVQGWAAFLNRCRGTIGCEAGTDYFELDDRTRHGVNAYVEANADASFEDVWERYFRSYSNPVSGRTISGRIIEAAATGTVQILLEGDYAGHFVPGEHYIPLRKDYANLDEAVACLRDEARSSQLAEAARVVALEQFAWPVLIGQLRSALRRIS